MGRSASLAPKIATRDTSDLRAQVLVAILALIGIGISTYLTYVHLSHTNPSCAVGDCEVVNTSPYAEMLGLPVALWGLSGYVAILALTLWQLLVRTHPKETVLGVFGLSLMGLLFSAYLTYLEIAVIHAICMWCVISAIVMTGIFALASRAVYRFSP